jgi:hypothetical protein
VLRSIGFICDSSAGRRPAWRRRAKLEPRELSLRSLTSRISANRFGQFPVRSIDRGTGPIQFVLGQPPQERQKAKSKKAVRTAPGNSAFGHRQGDAATRTMGRQNSRFGRATARAAKERNGNSNPRPTATDSPSANVSSSVNPNAPGGPGNSEFGHMQGAAETRTTGEQNSQFGRATAEQAKAGHPAPSPSETASPAP